MLEKSDYNNVNMSELNLSSGDVKKIIHVLDENLIISRNIQKGLGITERINEVIYFVFDELRDFCLARYLLIKAEDARDESFMIFFEKMEKLYINRQSPIEGILKYAYYYFKKNGHTILSQKILVQYGEGHVQQIVDEHNWENRENRTFDNFGLSLIFIDGGNIVDFEIEYIKKYTSERSSNYWEVFWCLLSNECVDLYPRIDLALRILIEDRSFNEIQNIINYFFKDRHEYRYHNDDYKPQILNLCDWIKYIEEENQGLSIELKKFLILLTVIDPNEHALKKYHEYALDETVCSPLMDMIADKEFESKLRLLQERINQPQQSMLDSILSYLNGGELDDC